jgi:hypothetical protein
VTVNATTDGSRIFNMYQQLEMNQFNSVDVIILSVGYFDISSIRYDDIIACYTRLFNWVNIIDIQHY